MTFTKGRHTVQIYRGLVLRFLWDIIIASKIGQTQEQYREARSLDVYI